MAKYNIYKHETYGFEAIKKGYSWPGFFFTWIWALTKKLWVQGVILVPIVFITNTLGIALYTAQTHGFEPNKGDSWNNLILTLILLFGPGIFVGIKGNTWRKRSMSKRGFDFVSEVEAHTVDGAMAATKILTMDHSDQVVVINDTKECPKCAETIKAKATICRYCGYEYLHQ